MEKIRFLTSLIFTNIIYYGTIIFFSVIWYYTKILELGFIFVPFMVCTVYYSIKTTKEIYIEYDTVKKLNTFLTIDEGLKHLQIAKNLVNELNKNGDVIYATRIDLICRKFIEKNFILWDGKEIKMKRFIFTKNENLNVEVEETYIEFEEGKYYENNNKALKHLENKKSDYEEKYRKNKELSKEERLDYIKTLWEIDTIQKHIFLHRNNKWR